ncbi:MAG: hypothetical protein ACTSV1_03375 [Alphaproteobacteria bacterium]
MEWLLVIMLSLPPEKADIGDLRFSTYEECMTVGQELTKAGTSLIRRKTETGEKKITITLEPRYLVERAEVICTEVPVK